MKQNPSNTDLLTKADICRIKGWSYEFLSALDVAPHHIGKRDYFTLVDVDEAIKRSKEQSWGSTKSKARRIGNTTSRYKAKGTGAARRRKKEAKLKLCTPSEEARH